MEVVIYLRKESFGNCEYLKKIISCVSMNVCQEECKDNKSNVIFIRVTTIADSFSLIE